MMLILGFTSQTVWQTGKRITRGFSARYISKMVKSQQILVRPKEGLAWLVQVSRGWLKSLVVG